MGIRFLNFKVRYGYSWFVYATPGAGIYITWRCLAFYSMPRFAFAGRGIVTRGIVEVFCKAWRSKAAFAGVALCPVLQGMGFLKAAAKSGNSQPVKAMRGNFYFMVRLGKMQAVLGVAPRGRAGYAKARDFIHLGVVNQGVIWFVDAFYGKGFCIWFGEVILG